jgi:hypothetical protein
MKENVFPTRIVFFKQSHYLHLAMQVKINFGGGKIFTDLGKIILKVFLDRASKTRLRPSRRCVVKATKNELCLPLLLKTR